MSYPKCLWPNVECMGAERCKEVCYLDNQFERSELDDAQEAQDEAYDLKRAETL